MCIPVLLQADSEQVYVPFNDLQMLCGMDIGEKRTSAIYMRFKPGTDLQQGRDKVAAMWQEFVVAAQQMIKMPRCLQMSGCRHGRNTAAKSSLRWKKSRR